MYTPRKVLAKDGGSVPPSSAIDMRKRTNTRIWQIFVVFRRLINDLAFV